MWLHEFCLGGAHGCWVNIFEIFAASMAWRYFIQTSVTSSGFHFLQTSFIIYNNLFRQGIWKSLWHFLSDPGTAWVLLQKNSWILTRENLCGPLWRPLKLCSLTDGEQMVWWLQWKGHWAARSSLGMGTLFLKNLEIKIVHWGIDSMEVIFEVFLKSSFL